MSDILSRLSQVAKDDEIAEARCKDEGWLYLAKDYRESKELCLDAIKEIESFNIQIINGKKCIRAHETIWVAAADLITANETINKLSDKLSDQAKDG